MVCIKRDINILSFLSSVSPSNLFGMDNATQEIEKLKEQLKTDIKTYLRIPDDRMLGYSRSGIPLPLKDSPIGLEYTKMELSEDNIAINYEPHWTQQDTRPRTFSYTPAGKIIELKIICAGSLHPLNNSVSPDEIFNIVDAVQEQARTECAAEWPCILL